MVHDSPTIRPWPFNFGGLEGDEHTFEQARAIILPVPFERTTSYGAGTKAAPARSSRRRGRWSCTMKELGVEPCEGGIHTLPAMESPFPSTEDAFAEMRKDRVVAGGIRQVLRGAGRRARADDALVAGTKEQHPGVTVLQI